MTKTPKPAEKAPFVPAVFDPTLADLAHIKAEAVTTIADATRSNPAMVMVTMESSVLISILTAARLHYYDNPYVEQPIDPSSPMAEIAEQRNTENKHWHWLMEDAIEVLTGRIGDAVIPSRAHIDNKEQTVASNRKYRPMMEKMDREDAAKSAEDTAAACLDESEAPEALARWFKTTNSAPMNQKELLKTLISLRRTHPLSWEDSMRLFSTASTEAANAKKQQDKIALALAALK
jgi:hypothetical protein